MRPASRRCRRPARGTRSCSAGSTRRRRGFPAGRSLNLNFVRSSARGAPRNAHCSSCRCGLLCLGRLPTGAPAHPLRPLLDPDPARGACRCDCWRGGASSAWPSPASGSSCGRSTHPANRQRSRRTPARTRYAPMDQAFGCPARADPSCPGIVAAAAARAELAAGASTMPAACPTAERYGSASGNSGSSWCRGAHASGTSAGSSWCRGAHASSSRAAPRNGCRPSCRVRGPAMPPSSALGPSPGGPELPR
mmetsp:Transcript_87698/g.251302  ORF Transcript_87698/g.251302 Transcript_87698/m.251302 type:complete len:250 (+) Transcript_87698:1109-1858(+)